MEKFLTYSEAIRTMLQVLNLPTTIGGCRELAKRLRVDAVNKIRIREGDYAGCWDDERINSRVAKPVLARYPQLVPLVERTRDEGSDYSWLCSAVRSCLEGYKWLAGEFRSDFSSLPGYHLPVKGGPGGTGVLVTRDNRVYIYKHSPSSNFPSFKPDLRSLVAAYENFFDAALDGWTVD